MHGRKNIDVEVDHDMTGTVECTHSGSFHVSYRTVKSPAVVAHDGGHLLG